MGPIVYRVSSGLRRGPRAALGAAVAVALTGALALTLVAGAVRTVSAPDRYRAWRGAAYDLSIEQSSGKPRTDEVAALPAVAEIVTATFVFGGIIAPGGDEPVNALLFAGSHLGFGTRLAEGREPDPSSRGEFAATPSFLRLTGAALGDEFQAITITQAQADERGFDVAEPAGPTWTGTLVGVIDGPSEMQDESPLAVFPAAALDGGDVGVAATVGAISLAPGATLDDLRAQLDALPNGEVFGLDAADWIPGDVRSAVSAQGQGLAVVAAIVALAAVAVVGQLLRRRLRPTETQLLTLAALGMTRGQVVADAVARAGLPVAAGSVGAAALAFAASGIFPLGFVERVEPHPGLLFDPLVHGAGAVALAVLLLGWVLITFVLGLRAVPSVRDGGLVERLARRIAPASAATAVRFAFGRPRPDSRSASLVGLVLVLGVLFGALTFGANLDRLLDEPARYGTNFDLGIGTGGDEVPEAARSALDADPNVTGLTLYGTVLAAVGAASLDVTGMQPVRGAIRPDIVAGRLAENDTEIVLGQVAARDLDVGVGDNLTITGGAGPVVFRVTGLAVIPSIEGGDGIGEGGVVTLDGLQRIDPSATLGTLAVELRQGAPADAVERISGELGVAVEPLGPPPSIVILRRVRAMPYLVGASLGALALLSMAHQLTVSAHRRRRDMAVLRALGADRRWITAVVHWQASAVALVVLAVAAPVGIALGNVVYRAFVDRMGAANDVSVPIGLVGVAVLAVMLVGNAVAAMPAHRARQRRPARILARE